MKPAFPFPAALLGCCLLPAVLVPTLLLAEDLAPLSDEFENPATADQWLHNEAVEGWGPGKLEQWDVDTSSPGRMRLTPRTSSWYQDFTGSYVHKEVSGDFVVTVGLRVTNRAGTGRPQSDFSLAGLMVRAPRGLAAASPAPDPGPDTVLPWPPPEQGHPLHYHTPWQPGSENYLFLSLGFATASALPDGSNPQRWQYEVKTTVAGVSTLYPRTHGVPEMEDEATFQMVRRGSTFLLLRRHGEGPWIIENRFERPDLPATLQVGITTYTDWNSVAAGWDFASPEIPFHHNRTVNLGGTPDLVVEVDFFRIRRPDPALDAAALQAVTVTGPDGPLRFLADSPLSAWLGENGHIPGSGGPGPGPTAEARPDLSIGRSVATQIGGGLRNRSGVGQKLVMRPRGNRLLSAVAIARNGAGVDDVIRLRGSRPPRGLSLGASLATGSMRINVTGALTAGGYLTDPLEPGETRLLRLALRPGPRFRGARIGICGEARGVVDRVLVVLPRSSRSR